MNKFAQTQEKRQAPIIAPKEREQELLRYQILDTSPEESYDLITKTIAHICQAPLALITFVSKERQWFKSKYGMDVPETPMCDSFCVAAIESRSSLFIVEDARKDPQFDNNPLVHKARAVVFYAGVPLITKRGVSIGTLAIIDNKPRKLSEEQLEFLHRFADQVMHLLKLRLRNQQVINAKDKLIAMNEELSKYSYTLAHDLKAPLRHINSFAKLIQRRCAVKLDEEELDMLSFVSKAAVDLSNLVDKTIAIASGKEKWEDGIQEVDLKELVEESIALIPKPESVKFEVGGQLPPVLTNPSILQRILLNLYENAIKYNDKPEGLIKTLFSETDEHYRICVWDNGPGMSEEFQKRAMDEFEIDYHEDADGNTGTGIGLATVASLAKKIGGKVTLRSKLQEFTCVTFSIKKAVGQ
ncbi:GAF domain-containing sensor histidine kinase [Phaeodactylibacter sp.]|uniref:sensor histidine kinase n=1 Tax=Phaeodactylibacter sp. TaxID=1940289 RepID=UPI0025F541B7|nr:GAF domain-containing sensor histidine kinase [Phaeodactylibacter sp.]MCI5093492.1 GAF domain-containing sensor histidine kinase [Phaeodactylibacter sp.]